MNPSSGLYELRLYVARPTTFPVMLEKWTSHHYAIYPDFHVVPGVFVARRGGEACDAEPTGIALLLQHEDRAAVDRSMAALIASDRMNQVPGPPGTTYVDHWERTFLHPLDISGFGGDATGTHAYEFRKYVAGDGHLEELMAEWEMPDRPTFAGPGSVLGAFVSQPEKYEPDGVALLVRHEQAAESDDLEARFPLPTPQRSASVERIERTILSPTNFSDMQ